MVTWQRPRSWSVVLISTFLNLVSDVVQRIGRRREFKTRIENRFKGWARLLVHASIGFALDRGLSRVFVARADWALQHTDPARTVGRDLFDRIYEHSVGPPFRALPGDRWWVLDVATNESAVLRADARRFPATSGPYLCVCHDIERGWGHLEDPRFAAEADAVAAASLERMLELEAAAGLRATYSVVGFLLPELAETLRDAGHCVAFHSFDHAAPGEPGANDQLRRCREVDYRIKGYRPARSVLGPELTDENLAFHNFEWLASSRYSLGGAGLGFASGIARLPLLFDDFDLHQGLDYDVWERTALETLRGAEFAAFSLHDCYAPTWLSRYRVLLEKVKEIGEARTLDAVAADLLLAQAV